jgi:tyrosyl-tRNA synthetase
MENAGQAPEVVIATGLIEGTDGSGAKMSKSRGNYVGLAFDPKDVFGKLMSAADRLVPDYLRALTELLDPEIALLANLHPMGVKTLLAAEVTSTIHGVDAALDKRAEFSAQFSRKRFSDTADVPTVSRGEHGAASIAELFAKVTGLVPSLNQARRVAAGGGLRLVIETTDGGQVSSVLSDANATLAAVIAPSSTDIDRPDARAFLRCGRHLIEVSR